MAKRPCLGPVGTGCPTGSLVEGKTRRCGRCAREYEQARGSRQERGYNASYDAAKRLPGYVSATHCAHCGKPFDKDNPKTAGHIDPIREFGPNEAGITPQCRRCNYGWRKTGT